MAKKTDNKKRTTINIDKEDFFMYQELIASDYFKNNLHLFTCAVFIGKYIVKKPTAIKSSRGYIRPNDNRNDDNLTILKSFAISENNDVNILNNEEDLYSFCEKYARTGIQELYCWYTDNSYDFDVILAEKLLEAWGQIDLSMLDES